MKYVCKVLPSHTPATEIESKLSQAASHGWECVSMALRPPDLLFLQAYHQFVDARRILASARASRISARARRHLTFYWVVPRCDKQPDNHLTAKFGFNAHLTSNFGKDEQKYIYLLKPSS